MQSQWYFAIGEKSQCPFAWVQHTEKFGIFSPKRFEPKCSSSVVVALHYYAMTDCMGIVLNAFHDIQQVHYSHETWWHTELKFTVALAFVCSIISREHQMHAISSHGPLAINHARKNTHPLSSTGHRLRVMRPRPDYLPCSRFLQVSRQPHPSDWSSSDNPRTPRHSLGTTKENVKIIFTSPFMEEG